MEKWLEENKKKRRIPFALLQQGIDQVRARYTSGVILQFIVLVRHFVLRLFNNEILKFENQRRQNLAILLAFLAIGGGTVATVTLFPYLSALPGFTSETVWIEKTFFITLSMAFVGIISVLNWENILLDEKDYFYLSALPIHTSTLFLAKFCSLLVFVGILSLALHFFTIFIFAFFLGEMVNINPYYSPSIITSGWVHLLATFMANCFVFLLVAFLQGILLILLKARGYRRISLVVQTLLMIGFVSVFIWFPQLVNKIPTWKENYSLFVYYFPPLWFVGFYELMIGNYDIVFKVHYYIAPLVVVGLMDLYLLSIVLGYKRFSFHATAELIKERVTPWSIIRRLFIRRFLKHPIERAIFYFSLFTLGRSRKHKLQLAVIISLPLTFVVTQIVILFLSKKPTYFMSPRPFLVAVPFIFYLFLVGGFRMMVVHPVAEEANWVFRMTEKRSSYYHMNGLKKAFFIIAILPVSVAVFMFYVYCWGPLSALLHTLFSAVSAWWLLDVVFINYRKIPFVSAYTPGKANLRGLWVVYLAIIGGYLFGFIWLGSILLHKPGWYFLYYLAVGGIFYLLRKYRLRFERDFAFIFDEEPMPEMFGLGLDMS